MTTTEILTGIKNWVLSKLSLKQDVINDLAAIRSGSQAGSTAVQPSDLSSYFNNASYDTNTHRINFYHGQNIVAYVDASPFIVDGMVDDVRIENGYLVIDFNTASGKQDISIPLTDIFDPSNYYNKTQTDALLGNKVDKVSGKGLSTNDYSNAEKEKLSGLQNYDDTQVRQLITQTNANFANYYTKAESYSATEVDEALGGKQNTINDLANIRSGASAGATAVQPSVMNTALVNTVAESGVYDVTANNNNAKFASLSALLSSENLNTLIPSAKRKGGMSIKFVLSSDNKYVQYRYIKTDATTAATFTNVDNWQSVDSVINSINKLEGSEHVDYSSSEEVVTLEGCYNTTTQTFQSNLTNYGFYSKLIKVKAGSYYELNPNRGNTNCPYAFLTHLPENNKGLRYAEGSSYTTINVKTTIKCPDNATYLYVNGKNSATGSAVYYEPMPVDRVNVKTMLDISDEMNYQQKEIENMSQIVGDINKSTFGDIYDYILNSKFIVNTKALVTVRNSESSIEGYISKITVSAYTTGTYQCYIGMLDQRKMMVNQRPFTLVISELDNYKAVVDVSDKKLFIKEGEQIFIEVNRNTIELMKSDSDHELSNCLIYAVEASGWVFVGYGNYVSSIGWNYEVAEVKDSYFAEKEQVNRIDENVNLLTELVNKNGIVYDENKNPFRIVVRQVGGVPTLVPKPTSYTKVVALGNSLTAHGYLPSIGWYGNGYAMAATRKETAWTSQLERILQFYDNNAEVTPFSIFAWEQNPAIDVSTITNIDPITSDVTSIDDVLTSDVDCVIFRAGENNATTPQTQQSYETGLTALVNYIQTKCPNADIVICGLMWHKEERDSAFLNVATQLGLMYVNTGNVGNNTQALGNMCLKYNATGSQPINSNEVFPVISSGVAGHIDDYGFYLFTNLVASTIGIEQLNELHSIEVESTVDYYLQRTVGVKNSIITIQTYGNSQPTISATDTNNNQIPVTHIDMQNVTWQSQPTDIPTWCSVFVMPNTDVTVLID